MPVIKTSFRQESQDRYLTYALSVVSGRALPDVRDGLKPVQRRILYAMLELLHLRPEGSYKKCATIVGQVLGKFHPHGDVACYEALVRMAQDFAMRYPLVDGQGNFGSIDGDGAAAYRYTEAKLQPIVLRVLGEIKEETVPFRDNFDSSTKEPVVLPSLLPNLLVNGCTGIAVGMATSIPPHNLKETCKALIELLKDPKISIAKLTNHIKGPDFPTGCLILNSKKEIDEIYQTGRGAIKMRGAWKEESGKRGKDFLIINSVPFAVNKAQLVEKIANLIIDKKIPQLLDVRDESTDDVRIVLEMKSGSDATHVMAFLYKHTPLETNFNVNLTALVPGEGDSLKPDLLSLKDMLQHFLDFRHEVVVKRLEFEKRNLEERIHILLGFIKIFDALDEAIKIVRKSTGRTDAAEKLRKKFKLTEIQSFAIVDLRIYQLSKTNIEEIKQELKEKKKRVKEIEAILKSKKKIATLVQKDLEKVAEEFGDNRRSKIVKDHVYVEIKASDFVVKEEVYAVVTADGWIKRIRQTNELGSTRLRDGDRILNAHPLCTTDSVVFFTSLGSVYTLSVNDFPSSSGYGDPVQKHLKFKDGEKVVASFGLLAEESDAHDSNYPYYMDQDSTYCLISRGGLGYSTKFDDLKEIKRSGKKVMKVRANDILKSVCPKKKKLSLISAKGYGLTIDAKEVLERSAPAVGVSLLGLRKGDEVIEAIAWDQSHNINLHLSNSKTKEIALKDIVKGKRSLKGNKLKINKEIIAVESNG